MKLATWYDSVGEPVYKDCEIIEYEIKELNTTDAMEYIHEHKLYYPED